MTEENSDREGIASPREIFAKRVNLPPGAAFALLVARIVEGYVWYWGASGKTPWTGWGWLPEWLSKEALYAQIPQYKWFLENLVIPNITVIGWVQFIVETTLAVMLVLGLFTGFSALISTIWALNIALGSYPIPGENSYALAILVVFPFVLWAVRAGRFVGVDAYLRPRLLASKSPALRWLGEKGT